ncbi:MAG: glycosyltransferase family 4 protein [Deltaproteobacteria bacterium]|nr:glycosyltransferase family 4 protein [Deltaproteobacteria bacterium]
MLAYTFYEIDNRVRRYAETLVKRGDYVGVIALRRENYDRKETINGVNVYRIQKRTLNEKGKFSYLYRIIKFLLKSGFFLAKKSFIEKIDLVHVHSVPDFEVIAALIPKLKGAKIVLDIHDIVPEFYASKFNTNNNSLIFKMLILVEKFSIAFSDHVIISNHIWHKTLTSRSVKKNKCTTIMNYPDNSIFYRRSLKRRNDKFIIIYPGTLSWHQGVDIAVKALAIIKNKVPEVEFHIYGEGPDRNDIDAFVKKNRLADRVFLNPPLPIDQIAELMANCDLGIVPKRNDSFGGEAFSTKTLEFMSLGVPIIVSRTKIDNYYFDESIVKFFEPENEQDLAESMLLLIKNSEFRETITSNALKFLNKNNWDIKQHIYLDLIDSLVESKKA